MLIYEQEIPITQIAYICGFSSLACFTYHLKHILI
ncbi:helix-turn-helix domain-containing protein [Peribacillus loiseleuriae]|nr:helix-turn-helix domain-containing protein [Peribacillus loiseleuriae]